MVSSKLNTERGTNRSVIYTRITISIEFLVIESEKVWSIESIVSHSYRELNCRIIYLWITISIEFLVVKSEEIIQ